MTAVPDVVWVTLMGERFHDARDCQGIIDGHAKATREGKRNFEAEDWPVRLAGSGWPRMLGRGPCEVCLPDATLPTSGQDDPLLVERAKAGRIAAALGNRALARDQARAAERRARQQFEVTGGRTEAEDDREAMREAMTPWDADHSTRDL